MKTIIPLAIVAILAVAALVALITQPWKDEAAGEVGDFAVCNVSVKLPEGDVHVGAGAGEILAMQLRDPTLPSDLPEQARLALADRFIGRGNVLAIWRGHGLDGPTVYINALTGQRIVRFGPAQDKGLDAVAATLRVIGNDEKTWPYRDVGAERREGVSDRQGGLLRWRAPDPMSGLSIERELGDAPPGAGLSGEALTLRGCKSRKTIVAFVDGTSNIAEDNVAPEDQAAFDAFFAEVEVVKP